MNRRPTFRARRGHLATLALGLGLALTAGEARATFVIGNLDQPDVGYTSGHQVGAAIVMDGTALPLLNIMVNESTFGPTSDESMGIYSRNADGTVGSLLFSDFTSDGVYQHPGITTFTVNTPFTLQTGVGYWFIITDNSTTVPPEVAAWDYTDSQLYTSNYGVTVPVTMTTYAKSLGGQEAYYDLADGPSLFQINAVPEPSSFVMMGFGAAGLGFWWRRRRQTV